MRRSSVLLVLLTVLLSSASSVVLAQTNMPLELNMIGNGTGAYYAPVGQKTQLKIEILNPGPADVFLVRGYVYLDPDLSGNWQLTHSEDLGNFHLAKLDSAVWTFDLSIPSHIQAANITNNLPQVELLMKITYAIDGGKQQSEAAPFLLNVPGAAMHTDYSPYMLVLGIILMIIGVVIVKNVKSQSKRKTQP